MGNDGLPRFSMKEFEANRVVLCADDVGDGVGSARRHELREVNTRVELIECPE